jgi:hypothetical protein
LTGVRAGVVAAAAAAAAASGALSRGVGPAEGERLNAGLLVLAARIQPPSAPGASSSDCGSASRIASLRAASSSAPRAVVGLGVAPVAGAPGSERRLLEARPCGVRWSGRRPKGLEIGE